MLEALIGLMLFSILVHYTLSWIENIAQAHRKTKTDMHLLNYASSVFEQLAFAHSIPIHDDYNVSWSVHSIDTTMFKGDDIFNKPMPTVYYATYSIRYKNTQDRCFKCSSWISTAKKGAL